MVITKFSGMEFIIATAAHDGQYSGDGNPYILHPLRVMSYMNNNFARILAVLHDVLRDSQEYNQQIILEKFDNHVLCPLLELTRQPHQSYDDYITGICGSMYTEVREVKFIDLCDNVEHDIKMLSSGGITTLNMIQKHRKALERVQNAIMCGAPVSNITSIINQ